jgi:hypothetical protein
MGRRLTANHPYFEVVLGNHLTGQSTFDTPRGVQGGSPFTVPQSGDARRPFIFERTLQAKAIVDNPTAWHHKQ